MNYGLYLSASGVLTNMHRQDVIANNLANASTVGFKRDLTAFSQRLPESQENPGPSDLADDLLDRLGGGMFVAPTRTDFRDGSVRQSGNDLDVAIAGEGFFAVQVDGQGQTATRLTRDGRMNLAADGRLVTTVGKHDVLDTQGRTIRLDPARAVEIDEQGTIRQAGEAVARIRLAAVDDVDKLQHLGGGLYEAKGVNLEEAPQAPGRLMQGWVEASNVDPVRETVQMIRTTRAIENNVALVRFHDTMMEQAATVLGRVS
jgi:flagellar basal-body rod protein FlgG